MTLNEIWQQLTRKNPKLVNDDATVEFTAANLRKLLRQVYDQGQKQGERKAPESTPDRVDPFDSMFRSFR